MTTSYRQTKNTQIHARVVSVDTAGVVESGKVVSFQGREDTSISLHNGQDIEAGVVYASKNGCAYEVGECVNVQVDGIAQARAGVALTKGQIVSPDANGDLMVYVPGASYRLGVVLQDAAVGSYPSVQLKA